MQVTDRIKSFVAIAVFLLFLRTVNSPAEQVVIGVIGDYGLNAIEAEDVAGLVKGWNPDFVMTVGDNNYETDFDFAVGRLYHDFLYPYRGIYGAGAISNRFFPSLGNHDFIPAYTDYFALPGNERYYNYRQGPVEIFALNCEDEPDGTSSSSLQGQWLQAQLTVSQARWRLVYFHRAPYSSGAVYGSHLYMQWPFEAWGASAVLSGHEHVYERLIVGGIPYFVNGLGGAPAYPFADPPLPQSRARYNLANGAMRIVATQTNIMFEFINRFREVIDSFSLPAIIITGMQRQPAASTVPVGTQVTFRVFAQGTGPLRCQWRFNGAELAGETNLTLVISNVLLSHTGEYRAFLRDDVASVLSDAFPLLVLTPPTVVVPPLGQSMVRGGYVTFSVVAAGDLPINYGWRQGGTILTNMLLNSHTSFFTLRNLQASHAGSYRVALTNFSSPTAVITTNAVLSVLADADRDLMADAWETNFSLVTNSPADALEDADGDGMSNQQEYFAGTDPRAPDSLLRVEPGSMALAEPRQMTLRFAALSNRTYVVEHATTFSNWTRVAELVALPTNRIMELTFPTEPSSTRFYRLSTPWMPDAK